MSGMSQQQQPQASIVAPDRRERPWAPGYKLYHGTNLVSLPSILTEGLVPRKGDGNWKHSVKSHRQHVYLSVAYALYFAYTSLTDEKKDAAVVLELEGRDVYGRACADEDGLEQHFRGRDGRDWDVKRRTIYYRSRAHLYPAELSLTTLGTCAVQGTVPVSAIKRVAIVSPAKAHELGLVGGIDPVISVINYAYMGAEYRRFHEWLFDGTGPWALQDPAFKLLGATPREVGRDEHIMVCTPKDALQVARFVTTQGGGNGS